MAGRRSPHAPTLVDVVRVERPPEPQLVLLAYSSMRNAAQREVVYAALPDGSHVHALGFGSRPILSPDGLQVAFTREEGRVLMVQPAGGGPAEVRFRAPPRGPVSRPDTGWFAFVGWLAGGRLLVERNDGIDVVEPDGALTRLLPARLATGRVGSVSISPAGDAVAFITSHGQRSDVYAALVREPGRVFRLTRNGGGYGPIFGPTGIAYTDLGTPTARRHRLPADIWFLPAGSTKPRQLTHARASILPVAFDASGRHLLAQNPAVHNGRLWAVDVTTGAARPLTPWVGDLFPQGISRDGRTILAAVGCGGFISPYGLIEELPFAGGAPHVVRRGPCRAAWTR